MEGGGSSNKFVAGSSSNSAAGPPVPGSSYINAQPQADQPRNNVVPPPQDHHIVPIANVCRIMRKGLPQNAKTTNEAKIAIQQCVTEFISFVTSEANEQCMREQRKIITAEDILNAMISLGFEDYVEPLGLYLRRYRESAIARNSVCLPTAENLMAPVLTPPPNVNVASINHAPAPEVNLTEMLDASTLMARMFTDGGGGGSNCDGGGGASTSSGNVVDEFEFGRAQ